MSDDLDLPLPPRDYPAEARQAYPQFYLLASPADEWLMDSLVKLRACALMAIDTPRVNVPQPIRVGLEKTTDAVERSFMDFREAVRASAAFERIDEEEQAKIERDVFEISAPVQK